MKVAFATCAAQADGREDDALAGDLIGAKFEVWDDPNVDWGSYDRVVIRSAWDYSGRLGEFLEWCESVGGARLRNQPELVGWNSDKHYLGELSVPVLATSFLKPGEPLPVFDHEIVIKPNISAGARHTGRFTPQAREEACELLQTIHESGRTALIQPYFAAVDEVGETSVVLLAGEPSHVLHKKPVLRGPGVAPLIDPDGPAAVMYDEDLVTAHTATDAQLALARAACAELSARFGTPLYLRVDMVQSSDGSPVVMELEAIEPALYLSESPTAAQAFATAVLGG